MPTVFNTDSPRPAYVYDSTDDTWYPLVGIAPASSVDRYYFTATSGATSISGIDNNGATLAYSAGTEQVYLNGVLLARTDDYTATNGTSITGLAALATNDIVEVITFNASNIEKTSAILSTSINAKGDLIAGTADNTAGILTVGTNGYVLSANSANATGLEWIAQNDSDAIQNSIVAAKGDIISASANDTPAILTVGNNGETLVADSSASTGLRWQSNFAAGKNKIINGDFGIWQRGTSFSNPANATYVADRWFVELDGSSFTRTISQQTFTPGTAPVAGYEGQYFLRWNTSVAGTSNTIQALSQRIEDIRTLSGQTVTLSFWAKADASRALTVYAYQQSTGGSGTVTTTVGSATLTTSWARYTMTIALPSMAGITIGTNSNLQIRIAMPTGTTMTCDFWGMQLEAGSTATAFQTATGTLAGELAACQRYYVRYDAGTSNYVPLTPLGFSTSTTNVTLTFQYPVVLRGQASAVDYANLSVYGGSGGAFISVSSLSLTRSSTMMAELAATVTGATSNNVYRLQPNNAVGYIGFTAEL